MPTNTNNIRKRLFFSILLDDTASEHITQAKLTLREKLDMTHDRAYRWVRPVDTHLTLFFIGDQSVDDVPAFIAAGTEAARESRAFTLDLHGLGQFPAGGSPRVLWAGAREVKSNNMNEIAANLRSKLHAFEIDRKAFNPHITLAYVRPSADQQELFKAMAHSQGDPRITTPHMMAVRQFALMESIPDGDLRDTAESRYTLVHSFLLQ